MKERRRGTAINLFCAEFSAGLLARYDDEGSQGQQHDTKDRDEQRHKTSTFASQLSFNDQGKL